MKGAKVGRKWKLLAGIVLVLSMFPVGGRTAMAVGVTHWVNDNGTPTPPGTSCSQPGYNRIQDAVNAATAGDLINVCPGTYREQVVIPAGKDSLTLRSVVPLAAVIQAP